jgi:hypothetical protein
MADMAAAATMTEAVLANPRDDILVSPKRGEYLQMTHELIAKLLG